MNSTKLGLTIAFTPGFFLAGCRDHPNHEVVVFAGSSMISGLEILETAYELDHPDVDIVFNFAGSQTLAMQINHGAQADIFISADQIQMDRVKGFDEPVVLVENEVVAIRSLEDNPASLQVSIEQAEQIVIAHSDVPGGRYARLALEGIRLWDMVEPKIVSQEDSVRSVLIKIEMGQADLGFVYRTDALESDNKVQLIEFPEGKRILTQTWIAVENSVGSDQSEAGRFARFLLESEKAADVYDQLGFRLAEKAP